MVSDIQAIRAVAWSSAAAQELPLRARNRRLVLDYFAARCCGRSVSVGDLHLRWARSRETMDEFLPLQAPAGVDAYVHRDLVGVLIDAGGLVTMRGWSVLRHPIVELRDGATWLDFIGSCRTRSPLRH